MTPFCLQAESRHFRKKRDEEASQSNQSQDVASAPKVPSIADHPGTLSVTGRKGVYEDLSLELKGF